MNTQRKNDSYGGRSQTLNDFHDEILKYILSFLTLEEAVGTNVLSKRWQYMWTSLPNLVFQEYGYTRTRKNFMDFVEKVLSLRDAPYIQNFSLSCRVGDDSSRISKWISAAVRHNARKFDFYLYNRREDVHLNDQHVFPHCLFSCETVEVLKIETSGFTVLLPSQVCLPRLRTLTLTNITFKDYHPTNLLFGSPALEELVIDCCNWEQNINELTISAPKLLSLTINEGVDEKYIMGELTSNSMTIAAPQLNFFRYDGSFTKDYHFPRPPSISKATLCFRKGTRHTLTDRFDELLSSLQLLHYLQISSSFVQALSHATMPIFKNLIFLDVYGRPVDFRWKELGMILNNCPHLETLRFPEGINCLYSKTYGFDRLSNLKLIYLPSTLKKFMIGYFSGAVKELSVVQFFLEKLTSLETMEIVFKCGVEQRMEIETLLSVLPRGSNSCKLHYT